MRTTVRIINFRSIQNTVFSVRNGLNVLVGSNGSGKTNILQSLRFLSSMLVDGAAVAMGRAGGPARNVRRGEREITFIVVSEYETAQFMRQKKNFLLRWEISISLTDAENLVQVSEESIRVIPAGGGPDDHVILVEIKRSAAGVLKNQVVFADIDLLTKKMVDGRAGTKKDDLFRDVKKRLVAELGEFKKRPPDVSFLKSIDWLHGALRRVLREVASFDEYNIQPEVARQATDPLPLIRMGNDGRAVSEVINALESEQYRRIAGPNLRGDYLHYGAAPYSYAPNYYWGGSLPKSNPLESIVENIRAAVSSIDGISTELDPSTGRRFILFKSGANRFRPEEISDGTIKWLCLLVAIYVPNSRVILLEEPENFMHPWMQQKFVALLREQTRKLNTSVILTTHSATILNALNVREVLLVHHGAEGTQVENVSDPKAVQKALDESDFGLGDIWVSGGIGGVAGGGA